MDRKIGLKDALAIGIGGMVGGGIFAVLGLAVSLAGGGTPLAFLIAGVLALVTSYSYVKLSTAFPDRGGTVRFINEGFGKTVFSGAINNLLWLSYIIMLALYASAFGSYAPNLLPVIVTQDLSFHIYASAVVILATVINYYSLKVVGKIETVAVVVKLLILLSFTAVGLYGLAGNPNLAQLLPQNWKSPVYLISAGMVIFVAYEGFELIANAVPDIRKPKKNVPRAFYGSIVFVVLLYVIIALVTVGSLAFDKIAAAQDYVLAEAARPMVGQAGFAIITAAALISTFSAINASLYGGSRVSYEIAEDDELPHHLTGLLWNHPIGLMITAVLTLVLVNTVNLESISTAGSVGFILVFTIVNLAGCKLAKTISAHRVIPLIGFIMGLISLAVLIIQQFFSNTLGVVLALSIITVCFLSEYIFKKTEAGRKRLGKG